MDNIIEFPIKFNQVPFKAQAHQYDTDSQGVRHRGPMAVKAMEEARANFPTTAQGYLDLCKRVMLKEDYCNLLCAIMDSDYYTILEPQYRTVADCYFDMKNKER
jgi:hypothetical protein